MHQSPEVMKLAAEFSHFINRASDADLQLLATQITSDHRTLQQKSMHLFMECIHNWADAHKSGRYDARNGTTCAVSAFIREELSCPDLKYVGTYVSIWIDEKSHPHLPYI